MKYYQTIKAYECLSGSRSNYKNRLMKGNVAVVRTIYDENGKVVKAEERIYQDREALKLK